MTQNNHYEHKLVNVGEEVDNLIESLREQNRGLQIIIDSKKDVPEDFEKEKKVYQFRIDMLEKQNKKLRDDMADAFKHSLNEGERVDYLEKVNNQHRFVFSEIPNNDFGRDFVNRMKYYLNSKRYRLRKRGQYLDDKTKETEGWKPYSDGQPLNKSKCIRVYIDCVANDTPEGFNKLEVDTIIDALDTHIDKCQEFVSTQYQTTRQLLSYFTEMKTHIEECQSNMGETNNVT